MKGSCACGAVRYEVNGPARPIIACHCVECRKITGHFSAATAVRPDHLQVEDDEALRWYRASETAERGFCSRCGSTLFWRPDTGDRVSIYAGSIDGDHDLQIAAHIFVGEKGSYYDVEGGRDVAVFDAGGAELELPGQQDAGR